MVVGSHDGDISAACLTNTRVHSVGRCAVGIVDNLQPSIVAGNLLKNLERAVVRHTVCHYNLESTGRWLLSQNRSNTAFDMILFVTTGDHDRYRGSGIVVSGHFAPTFVSCLFLARSRKNHP